MFWVFFQNNDRQHGDQKILCRKFVERDQRGRFRKAFQKVWPRGNSQYQDQIRH